MREAGMASDEHRANSTRMDVTPHRVGRAIFEPPLELIDHPAVQFGKQANLWPRGRGFHGFSFGIFCRVLWRRFFSGGKCGERTLMVKDRKDEGRFCLFPSLPIPPGAGNTLLCVFDLPEKQ